MVCHVIRQFEAINFWVISQNPPFSKIVEHFGSLKSLQFYTNKEY